MAAHNPLWIQALPQDLRRRLDRAEATAREARLDTHAAQAITLVYALTARMPFNEAIDRYLEIMDLHGDEAEEVRTRALAQLDESLIESHSASEQQAGWGLDWRYATPLGAVRFVRRKIRRSAEEELWMELAAARAEEALIRTHIKHAIGFASLLEKEAPPPRSVSLYLERLEVPAARARSVYQRTLAELAEVHLPRILQARRLD